MASTPLEPDCADSAGLELDTVLSPRSVVGVNPNGIAFPTPFDDLWVLDALGAERCSDIDDVIPYKSQRFGNPRDQGLVE